MYLDPAAFLRVSYDFRSESNEYLVLMKDTILVPNHFCEIGAKNAAGEDEVLRLDHAGLISFQEVEETVSFSIRFDSKA